ncbi:hypothetical protein EJB05_56352, partial [Eragrostis curvula]
MYVFIHIDNAPMTELSPVDVHKSPNEANAKKAYNNHCVWVDRSAAFPPTSAQYPMLQKKKVDPYLYSIKGGGSFTV